MHWRAVGLHNDAIGASSGQAAFEKQRDAESLNNIAIAFVATGGAIALGAVIWRLLMPSEDSAASNTGEATMSFVLLPKGLGIEFPMR